MSAVSSALEPAPDTSPADIFDNVIGPHGLLKSKARILCTNMVTYLPDTDDIVMLRRGIVLERSDYETVRRVPYYPHHHS